MIFHQVFENAVRPAGLAASGSDGRDSQECNVLNNNPIEPVDASSLKVRKSDQEAQSCWTKSAAYGDQNFFCGKVWKK